MKLTKQLSGILLISFALAACSSQQGSGSTSGSGGTSSSSSGGLGGTSGGTTIDPAPTQQPAVGIPDQNSMTLVASTINVPSWGLSGVETTVTVFLADQLNNSSTIADGTIVYFAAEGGAIQPSCTTTNGACTVTWRSQLPVPTQIAPERAVAGRDTILAWTLGTESFFDNNSNGFFDDGDTQVNDIGEPFIDKNENGTRDTDEEFVNFPNPGLSTGGSYDVADGRYAGVNCAHSAPNLCADDQSVFIFRQLVLTNSSDVILIWPVTGNGPFTSTVLPSPIDVDGGSGSVTLSFLITDSNGNPPPLGTTISFSADVGTLLGSGSFTVQNTSLDMGITSPWPTGLVTTVTIVEDAENTDNEFGFLTITADAGTGGNVSEAFYSLFDPAL